MNGDNWDKLLELAATTAVGELDCYVGNPPPDHCFGGEDEVIPTGPRQDANPPNNLTRIIFS